jgi:signal transduction histidine kinase
MNKSTFLILILLSICITLSYAYDEADSLKEKIDILTGLEQVQARLDYAYILRRIDMTESLKQAELAYKEIKNKYYTKDLEAEALYHIGLPNYYSQNYLLGLEYFFKAVSLSKETGNRYLLCELYFFIGATYYFHYGDYSQAIRFYNLSIQEGLSSDNYKMLGAVYSSLSNIFRINGSYEKSLELVYKSRENYKKANYREGIAWVNYAMGSLYHTVGLNEEAKKVYNEALEEYRYLAGKDGKMTGIAICLDQLTIVNSDLGDDILARRYNREAMDYYKSENSQYGLSNALKYRAILELKAGNYESAIANLDSALQMKKKLKDFLGFSSIYDTYGSTFIALKQYDRARDSLEIGLQHAIKNKQMKNKIDIDKNLSRVYEAMGDYQKAYKYKSQEANVADSIYSTKLTRNMIQLESLYEIESRESKIKLLEKENKLKEISLLRELTVRKLLIVIILFSIGIIFMYIYFFREKQKANLELKQSKQQVDDVNLTREKFFSIIAHDLRSPFNSILGLTKLLKDYGDTYDKEKIKEIINTIHDSTKLSYELLNNLLEWSRTQSNTISFSPEYFDLDHLISNIKKLLSTNAQDKQINIIIPEQEQRIFADKNMIHTIIRNLVSNAIKYSEIGGEIIVRYKQENNNILISITDQGMGISKSNINRLFKIDDPYYSDGTVGEKGTGLGLIICKEFVEKHNGKIWVESEISQGSTFFVSIPLPNTL